MHKTIHKNSPNEFTTIMKMACYCPALIVALYIIFFLFFNLDDNAMVMVDGFSIGLIP